jgi:hypothetical protein
MDCRITQPSAFPTDHLIVAETARNWPQSETNAAMVGKLGGRHGSHSPFSRKVAYPMAYFLLPLPLAFFFLA